MALKVHYKFKQHGVDLTSGYYYIFNYSAFENDPEPIVLYLNTITGTHPKTKRQWRFHQGINLNYLPRTERLAFVENWNREILKNKGNVKLTWNKVQVKYPYMKAFIRRYFYTPAYYIRNLKYIPPEAANDVIVKSYFKDYSSYVKRRVASHFRQDQMKGQKR